MLKLVVSWSLKAERLGIKPPDKPVWRKAFKNDSLPNIPTPPPGYRAASQDDVLAWVFAHAFHHGNVPAMRYLLDEHRVPADALLPASKDVSGDGGDGGLISLHASLTYVKGTSGQDSADTSAAVAYLRAQIRARMALDDAAADDAPERLRCPKCELALIVAVGYGQYTCDGPCARVRLGAPTWDMSAPAPALSCLDCGYNLCPACAAHRPLTLADLTSERFSSFHDAVPGHERELSRCLEALVGTPTTLEALLRRRDATGRAVRRAVARGPSARGDSVLDAAVCFRSVDAVTSIVGALNDLGAGSSDDDADDRPPRETRAKPAALSRGEWAVVRAVTARAGVPAVSRALSVVGPEQVTRTLIGTLLPWTLRAYALGIAGPGERRLAYRELSDIFADFAAPPAAAHCRGNLPVAAGTHVANRMLCQAITNGHVDMAKYLLEAHGANPTCLVPLAVQPITETPALHSWTSLLQVVYDLEKKAGRLPRIGDRTPAMEFLRDAFVAKARADEPGLGFPPAPLSPAAVDATNTDAVASPPPLPLLGPPCEACKAPLVQTYGRSYMCNGPCGRRSLGGQCPTLFPPAYWCYVCDNDLCPPCAAGRHLRLADLLAECASEMREVPVALRGLLPASRCLPTLRRLLAQSDTDGRVARASLWQRTRANGDVAMTYAALTKDLSGPEGQPRCIIEALLRYGAGDSDDEDDESVALPLTPIRAPGPRRARHQRAVATAVTGRVGMPIVAVVAGIEGRLPLLQLLLPWALYAQDE